MTKYLFIFSLFFYFKTSAQNLTTISYLDNTTKLNGLTIKNAKKNKPGVLILPAWKGIDNEAKQAAKNLNNHGYNVFIADIYGENNYPTSNDEAKKISSHYKSNPAEYHNRIKLALDQLIKLGANPDKIAVIGYCFGGTGALESARAQLNVKGVVSIHGNLGKGDRNNGPLNTKILVLHGADDAAVSEQEIKNFENEVKTAKADWQMIYYANCKHTFTNPESADYNQVMANRSWKHTLLFLDEILK